MKKKWLIGLVALFMSVVLEKFGLKSASSAFVLEFPPYRLTSPKRICVLVWQNLKLFLIKITTIFVSMNVIVWCLSSFSFGFGYVPQTGERSMLEVLGAIFAPIFAPLGFNNWGAVSALIAGIVAKEIVVSSIAIFNGISKAGADLNLDEQTNQIGASLTNPASAVYFTPASALSYMSFCLLYTPCLATMAVLKKEIGLKWTLISIFSQVIVAYIVAFLVYNCYLLLENFGFIEMLLVFISIFVILISLICVCSHLFQKNKCKKCGLCKM